MVEKKEVTQRNLLLAGKFYWSFDADLAAERDICSLEFLPHFNSVVNDTTKSLAEKREIMDNLCKKYLGAYGEGSIIVPPFFADFGSHIFVGKNCYINMNCTFLDTNLVTIEDNVMIAPNVGFYTATHPIRYSERGFDPETVGDSKLTFPNGSFWIGAGFALPIVVKEGAWIGAGAILMPGVTIGKRSIVGAGSVVTRSVDDDSIVAGNPAKFIRKIDQREVLDEEELQKELVSATTLIRRRVIENTIFKQQLLKKKKQQEKEKEEKEKEKEKEKEEEEKEKEGEEKDEKKEEEEGKKKEGNNNLN